MYTRVAPLEYFPMVISSAPCASHVPKASGVCCFDVIIWGASLNLWWSPGCRHGSVHVARMHAWDSEGVKSSICVGSEWWVIRGKVLFVAFIFVQCASSAAVSIRASTQSVSPVHLPSTTTPRLDDGSYCIPECRYWWTGWVMCAGTQAQSIRAGRSCEWSCPVMGLK